MKDRSLTIDLLKIIASFFVVIFHYESFVSGKPFSPFYFIGWYAVPVFVVCTFYLNGKYFNTASALKTKIYKKISRFIYPFLFWSTIGFLLHPSLISPKLIGRQVLFGTSVDPPLYYLNIIVIFSLIWYLLRKLNSNHKNIIYIILIVLSLVYETYFSYQQILGFFPIQAQFSGIRLFELLKFAAIGSLLYMYKNKFIPLWKRKTFLRLLILISTISIGLDIVGKWIHQPQEMGYTGFLLTLGVMGLTSTFIYLEKKYSQYFFSKTVNYWAKYSLGIYCIHYFLIEWEAAHTETILVNLKNYPIFLIPVTFALSGTIAFLIDKISLGRLSWSVS